MTRIDAHHHLWYYTDAEYGWIGDDQAALRRNFLLEDLQLEFKSASIDGTVAVQARQTLQETQWLLDLAEPSSPILGVVGWLPLTDSQFPSLLERYTRHPKLKGLRHVVQAEPAGFLDGDAFNKGIARLSARGLVYDILVFAHQLTEVTRFVDRHPQQEFVLDHIAKPSIRTGELSAWSTAIRELARRPNVSCKLSGMVTEADWTHWSPDTLEPYFQVVLEAFRPQRLMIGTDWPVLTVGCTYGDWWRTVEHWTRALTATERADILGQTAIRVYSLDPVLSAGHLVTAEERTA
jgi:L-fuconolactonase